MKKSVVFLLLIILALSSCQKELPQALVGKWHHYKSNMWYGYAEARYQQDSYSNRYYEFSDSGTVKIYGSSGDVKEYVYSYDAANNKLTIAKDYVYYIDSYSSKEMVWRWEDRSLAVIDGKVQWLIEDCYYYLKKE